jgi:hypothetical protein
VVAVSFSVFRDKLLSGEKDQTIRPFSECRYCQIAKKGRKLQIYWKQRTKECEKLFDATPVEVFKVWLDPDSRSIYRYDEWAGKVPLTAEEQEEIVRRDGFDSVESFFEFFLERYGEAYLRDNAFMVIRFRRCER